MKTKLIQLLWLVAVFAPMSVSAQTNVRKAFEKLIQSPKVEYTESHSLEKNPQLNVKESQSDVYNFTLPADQYSLVENIIKAFKEDEDQAYSVSAGKADKNSLAIRLAVGDGRGSGVLINPEGYNYYYSCFTDPENKDNSKEYRYAYGICWKKSKDKVEGKLVTTYATTLNYRQTHHKQSTTNNSMVILNGPSAPTWFSTIVYNIQRLSQHGTTDYNRSLFASEIYKQAQKTQTEKDIPEADKDAARELLKALISEDGKRFNQQTLVLLNQALINIK